MQNNPRVSEQRQLTPEQKQFADQDIDRIMKLEQQQKQGRGSIYNQQGLISQNNTSMPQLSQNTTQGSRYSVPFGQRLMQKSTRVIDIYDKDEYFSEDANMISTENFNAQQVYRYYCNKSKRYRNQAFLELYLSDALQYYAKSREEYQELNHKVKKVAQLTTKLHNLTLLMDVLNVRLKLGRQAPPETLQQLQQQQPMKI